MDLVLLVHSTPATDKFLLPNRRSYFPLTLPRPFPSRRKLPSVSPCHAELKSAIFQGEPHCTPDFFIHLSYSVSANASTSTTSTAAA